MYSQSMFRAKIRTINKKNIRVFLVIFFFFLQLKKKIRIILHGQVFIMSLFSAF